MEHGRIRNMIVDPADHCVNAADSGALKPWLAKTPYAAELAERQGREISRDD